MATGQNLTPPEPGDDQGYCPECDKVAYSFEQDRCLHCGFEPESIADLLDDDLRAEAEKAFRRPLKDEVIAYILKHHQPKEK